MPNKKHKIMKVSILKNQVFCKKTVQIAKKSKKKVLCNYREMKSLFKT